MKPKKILFVHSSDEMYGADFILLQLVTHLDRAAFEPLVVLPNDLPQSGLLGQALQAQGVRVLWHKLAVLRRHYFTPWGLLLYGWRLGASSWALARLIWRERVDLVHSHTAAVLSGAMAAQLTRRPHVWQTLEMVIRPYHLRRLLAWLLPRWSVTVVAAAAAVKSHLCADEVRHQTATKVIHFGLNPADWETLEGERVRLRAEWGIPDDCVLVGMVGRVSQWKGQDYFLQVAQLVAQPYPQVRFALVGGVFHGQEQLLADLQAQIASLGLVEVVHWHDFRQDITAVLAAYDILVLPSTLPDPLPTVVLEAMAAGKPVVANAHGGSVEMVVDGVTGLLVEPGQPEEMAAAILHLLYNPEVRVTMGQNGRLRLAAHFTLDQFIEQWTAVYQSILSPQKIR
jgi:glycosyltransferase involved in cell wall biosynthesis